ncbi:MAG: hypothetical protein H6858_02525 [Rhodospirillales bacterium]|nr:hypothetical protein [Alphaproteobacteria bacterium]MCB1839013.1 hypothetical protein [Alphaproteobacteria bacterium]MCB9976458.1 hypothetical protein [Rhodospirillales bacterium]
MNRHGSAFKRLICVFAGLLCVAVVLCPEKAYAARFSGEYLLKVCALDKQGEEMVPGGKIACQSYISAVIDYHNFLRTLDAAGPDSFCIPDDVSLNEIQLVVLLYFLKNKKLHKNFIAAPGVEMALIDAYPCNRKKGH